MSFHQNVLHLLQHSTCLTASIHNKLQCNKRKNYNFRHTSKTSHPWLLSRYNTNNKLWQRNVTTLQQYNGGTFLAAEDIVPWFSSLIWRNSIPTCKFDSNHGWITAFILAAEDNSSWPSIIVKKTKGRQDTESNSHHTSHGLCLAISAIFFLVTLFLIHRRRTVKDNTCFRRVNW